jgi:hypothetical protein
MPNRSAEKGSRFERNCVGRLRALGVAAVRVPLSGAAGGDYSSDLRVGPDKLKIECKTRKRFIGQFLGWLEGNYALFVKEDRSETLVVMRLDDFAALLGDW